MSRDQSPGIFAAVFGPCNALLSRLRKTAPLVLLLLTALHAVPREKGNAQYGTGLIVNIPYPETEVTQVVHDVVQNGIIRGTKEYNKDEYITGATAASSSRVFPERTKEGKVFYKVRLKALDPRNFKDSGDLGTLAVRYTLQAQDDKHTVLRIDARFVEDFRHIAHPSNGSVEGAEYKAIHDRLESLELMKSQTADAEKTKQQSSSKSPVLTADDSISNPAPATPNLSSETRMASSSTETAPPVQTLEERVQELRREVERVVKAPGASLKSAPFHTASTLQTLPPGAEILIVISTPYWFGVETHEGQHGWILRDDLGLVK